MYNFFQVRFVTVFVNWKNENYIFTIWKMEWDGIKHKKKISSMLEEHCIINTGQTCVVPMCTYLKIQ